MRAHVCVCCGWVVVVACVCLLGRWGGGKSSGAARSSRGSRQHDERAHTRAHAPQ